MLPDPRLLSGAVIAPEDVRAAAATLRGIAHRTPVFSSHTLDERVGAHVLLKAEGLQRSGSFKFRGAYNKISSLTGAERERGVLAFSSGNHAQAVALASSLLGTSATILMPADAPALKLDATRGYGAHVVTFDRYTENREQLAADLVSERNLTLVRPFDDPLVMAGQGTAALELIEDGGELDVLLAPVGGGGLMAGCATIARDLCPGVRIVAVEPEAGDDHRRSLAAGERVALPAVPRTIADSLQITTPGELTFEVNSRLVDAVATVSDAELVEAMRFAFERMKIVTEPGGVAGLAALLAGKVELGPNDRVGVILSGANCGADRFAELLSSRSRADERREEQA
jgi:threo-3-hydroxy-L-aspartate ammonia-lyase